ncbi:hypothetical protein Emag_002745 [Eimeria magna]
MSSSNLAAPTAALQQTNTMGCTLDGVAHLVHSKLSTEVPSRFRIADRKLQEKAELECLQRVYSTSGTKGKLEKDKVALVQAAAYLLIPLALGCLVGAVNMLEDVTLFPKAFRRPVGRVVEEESNFSDEDAKQHYASRKEKALFIVEIMLCLLGAAFAANCLCRLFRIALPFFVGRRKRAPDGPPFRTRPGACFLPHAYLAAFS